MTSIWSFIKTRLGRAGGAMAAIDEQNLPQHVAIIMDGNGRWAQRRALPRIAGHRAGARIVRAIVQEAARLKIKFLTLYAFSAENWRRPKAEVGGLMKLFEEILRSELDELHGNNIRIKVIGELSGIADGARLQFEKAIEQTAANTGMTLIIALNYGGRADILRVVNELIKAGRSDTGAAEVDEARFGARLATASIPDPELLIRTSGEMRLSNFLIWESAYSEFLSTPVLWPDFSADDFRAALGEYQRRDRRFGGLSGPPSEN